MRVGRVTEMLRGWYEEETAAVEFILHTPGYISYLNSILPIPVIDL